jgi:hypothetical protein
LEERIVTFLPEQFLLLYVLTSPVEVGLNLLLCILKEAHVHISIRRLF